MSIKLGRHLSSHTWSVKPSCQIFFWYTLLHHNQSSSWCIVTITEENWGFSKDQNNTYIEDMTHAFSSQPLMPVFLAQNR